MNEMGEKVFKNIGDIDYAVKDSENICIQCGDGSKPVGVVHLDKKTGCVYCLIVLEEKQGNDLGTILLQKIEIEAKKLGINKIYSEITEANEKSKKLFTKCGYVKSDVLPTSVNDYNLKMEVFEKNI